MVDLPTVECVGGTFWKAATNAFGVLDGDDDFRECVLRSMTWFQIQMARIPQLDEAGDKNIHDSCPLS